MRIVDVPSLRCPVTGARLRLYVEALEFGSSPDREKDTPDEDELTCVFASSNLASHLPPTPEPLTRRLRRYSVMEGALYTEDWQHVYPVVKRKPLLQRNVRGKNRALVEYYRSQLLANPACWKTAPHEDAASLAPAGGEDRPPTRAGRRLGRLLRRLGVTWLDPEPTQRMS